ncbi:MAG TPA: hypothetical protein VJV39_14280 [Dongiaceae bacterium]|nr:hypothetical protein [Dongiaceae bacterium]
MSPEFKAWIEDEFADRGAFTVLVALVEIGERSVTPLVFTCLNVTETKSDWSDMVALFDSTGVPWDGASFFPVNVDGGPLDDAAARVVLRAIEQRVKAEPLVLNEGFFFARDGQRIMVEKADPH